MNVHVGLARETNNFDKGWLKQSSLKWQSLAQLANNFDNGRVLTTALQVDHQ